MRNGPELPVCTCVVYVTSSKEKKKDICAFRQCPRPDGPNALSTVRTLTEHLGIIARRLSFLFAWTSVQGNVKTDTMYEFVVH